MTATELAKELDVSERTVYRDIADLQRAGVPIEGEAGVGYVLDRGFDLPPLMFNEDQIEALVLGAKLVETWGDEAMAQAARSALTRIETVLSPRTAARLESTALFVTDYHVPKDAARHLSELRHAIHGRQKTRLGYRRADGHESERLVRPLGLILWRQVWTLCAWCELRDDFRSFRLDRIHAIEATEETYAEEAGRTLEDFLSRWTE